MSIPLAVPGAETGTIVGNGAKNMFSSRWYRAEHGVSTISNDGPRSRPVQTPVEEQRTLSIPVPEPASTGAEGASCLAVMRSRSASIKPQICESREPKVYSRLMNAIGVFGSASKAALPRISSACLAIRDANSMTTVLTRRYRSCQGPRSNGNHRRRRRYCSRNDLQIGSRPLQLISPVAPQELFAGFAAPVTYAGQKEDPPVCGEYLVH